MKLQSILAIAITATICGVGGCAPIVSHGEFVPNAPYAQFHTFSFASPEAAPAGYHASARSALIVEQMKPIIASVLERKGYLPAPTGEGDIIVVCAAGRREGEREMRLPWRITELTGEEFEDHDFVEGGVVIDALDRTGGQIWHGAARTDIDPLRPSSERLRRTVEAALARFPAHPSVKAQ